jgi:hypothetical protein
MSFRSCMQTLCKTLSYVWAHSINRYHRVCLNFCSCPLISTPLKLRRLMKFVQMVFKSQINDILLFFSFFWHNIPQWARASSFTRFLDHTQRRTTVGRTPVDEWSARRRDLYLTTHNTQNKHPCPRWDSSPRSQQASGPQTYVLDRASTGTSN